ncbi:MAG: hypothetical protein E6G55_06445 [Actinobacteria bacterium]|nr:MAG: hypothetical protein E6G55_06445 [Actinomycetota bacterium]
MNRCASQNQTSVRLATRSRSPNGRIWATRIPSGPYQTLNVWSARRIAAGPAGSLRLDGSWGIPRSTWVLTVPEIGVWLATAWRVDAISVDGATGGRSGVGAARPTDSHPTASTMVTARMAAVNAERDLSRRAMGTS